MNIDSIQNLLKNIADPIKGGNIIQQLLVKDISVTDNRASFTLALPTAYNSYKANLNLACTEAILTEFPNADVHIHMETVQASSFSSSPLPRVKNIIAVASGKGGVGKSTVTFNLARSLQSLGARVGVLDADLYGPSLPTMFGLEGARPNVNLVEGKHKIQPIEKDGIHVMSMGFIVEAEQAVVLRGPRLAGVIKQFILDCSWPELDYLLIDLPPGTGDIQLTLVQTVPLTGAIIVTTPQKVAVVDAVKAMNMFMMPNINVPILGVVENMAWFTPKELPNSKYRIFGEGGGKSLAKQARTILLGQVPLVMELREAADSGVSPLSNDDSLVTKAFVNIAQNTARQAVIRNETIPPTSIVDVK